MRRPSIARTGLTAVFLLASLAALRVAAAEKPDDEVGALGGIGIADSALVGDGEDGVGPVLGARYGHEFTDKIGVSADLLYGMSYPGETAQGDWSELTLGGSMDWFFKKTPRTQWFLSPGLGWTELSPDSGSSVSRGLFTLAIGQRFWPGEPDANMRWMLRADQTVGSNGVDGASVLNYKLLLGVSWGFGGPPPDADADGVPDRKDKCPDTPKGATVDETGCPKDSDGDGVLDGIDACADTPAGWPVDEKGCPKDTDGDGVPDGKDTCPDTPKGATVDTNGCPKDADGDGVFDGIDRCPDTPKGAKVSPDGCPVDTDGDGVFDGIDRCPDTPKDAKVDATGCPVVVEKAPPLFTPEKKTLVLEGVNFEYDSAALTPGSLGVLDTVAASLKDWPEVRVEIGGHTDDRGASAYNQKLSEKRAESVRDYLVGKGIDASRMTTKGYGESTPIADNKTDEGRAKNRRVELSRLD